MTLRLDGELLLRGEYTMYEGQMLCGIWMEMRSCALGDSMSMAA